MGGRHPPESFGWAGGGPAAGLGSSYGGGGGRSWPPRVPVCGWGDLLASVGWVAGWGGRDELAGGETATTAIRFRFGGAGLLGALTPGAVAVAASGGRLLAPGWLSSRG